VTITRSYLCSSRRIIRIETFAVVQQLHGLCVDINGETQRPCCVVISTGCFAVPLALRYAQARWLRAASRRHGTATRRHLSVSIPPLRIGHRRLHMRIIMHMDRRPHRPRPRRDLYTRLNNET
jgi:hypothetical protein